MIRSIHIAGNEPVHTDHPTSDWWTVTTSFDKANPNMVIEVPMDSEAAAVARAYDQYLTASAYACDPEDEDTLRGQAVTIYLTAPDGTQTEHEGCFS